MRLNRFSAVLTLLALLAPGLAFAHWLIGGIPISTQRLQAYDPAIVPDGAGGAVFAWAQDVVVDPYIYVNHYAMRFDSNGDPVAGWPRAGVPLYTENGSQTRPPMVPDGTGGAFVAFTRYRPESGHDVLVQRVTGAGTIPPEWPAQGAIVCDAPEDQSEPVMTSDDAGGVILAWTDRRGGDRNVYAQRLNATGIAQWEAGGIPVADATGARGQPSILPDGAGGVFIAWSDSRDALITGDDIYAQRLTALGAVASGWVAMGVPVCRAPDTQDRPVLCPDGTGGAIVVWNDTRDFANQFVDLYAHRFSATGVLANNWPEHGDSVCVLFGSQQSPAVVSDGSGGAYIAWQDDRNGANLDVYMQHLQANGAPATGFPATGLAVSVAANSQSRPALLSIGSEVLVVWQDRRAGVDESDIYASRYRPDGTLVEGWTDGGDGVSTWLTRQLAPQACTDGAGGALVTWLDLRNGAADVYAGRVEGSVAAPTITLVGAEATETSVSLRWHVVGTEGAHKVVYRRVPDGAWQEIGSPTAVAAESLTYVDHTVAAGATYDYRHGVHLTSGELLGGEVRVTVPFTAHFGIVSVSTTSATGDVLVRFALESATPGRIDLFDITGRRIAGRELSSYGPGVHDVTVASGVTSGLYVVRITQAGRARSARVPVVR